MEKSQALEGGRVLDYSIHYFLWKADFWLSDLKRKYAAAPNQMERDSKRMRYVENPNSGVAKAKVIESEVEVNTFLSEISISSVVLN